MDINKAAERAIGAIQAQQTISEEIARGVVAQAVGPILIRIEALEAEVAELKAQVAKSEFS